jgi:hypothetical protein
MSRPRYYISLPESGCRLSNQPQKETWAVLKAFLADKNESVLIIGKHSSDDEEIKNAIFEAVEYAEKDL